MQNFDGIENWSRVKIYTVLHLNQVVTPFCLHEYSDISTAYQFLNNSPLYKNLFKDFRQSN